MTGSETTAVPPELAVLVVDDHPLIRQGVRSLLGTAVPQLAFYEAASATEAQERVRQHDLDLLIVDMILPDSSGFDLIRQLRDDGLDCPIIALSMHGEATYAERALRAGASGYVMKEEVGGVLLTAVARVLAGDVHVSPSMATRLAARLSSGVRSGTSIPDLLTDRELQIWQHLGNGLSTRRIASMMEISPKTVETHCFNIRRKAGLADVTELVHAATRWVHGDAGRE